MNALYLYIVPSIITMQPWAFLSFGILSDTKNPPCEPQPNSVLSNPASIPHLWYFTIQLALVLLFANADINSRVASTIPIFYWIVSSLILEGNSGDKQTAEKASKVGWFACMHNLVYMGLNLVLFPMEVGFV